MSQQLDDLRAAVAAEHTVIDSAVVLLQGLSAQIAAGANDGAAMIRLADEVRAKADALAAAVAANTPAPGEVIPPSFPTETPSEGMRTDTSRSRRP